MNTNKLPFLEENIETISCYLAERVSVNRIHIIAAESINICPDYPREFGVYLEATKIGSSCTVKVPLRVAGEYKIYQYIWDRS